MKHKSVSKGFICMSLAMAVSLLLIGLGAGNLQAAGQINKVSLKLQDYSSPKGARAESIKWFMQEVTKRSGGKIKFNEYWSKSLVQPKEALEATSNGLADIGMIALGLFKSHLPLHQLGGIPLGAQSYEAAAAAFADLYQEVPEFKQELDKYNVRLLYVQGVPPLQLHFRKPIKKLEDMQGLKVRSYGLSSKALDAWGSTPVAMPFTEIYEALNLGTIDGTVSYIWTQKPYRHYEVAKHYLVGNFGAMPATIFIMSNKAWEKVGAGGQKIIAEVSKEAQKVLIDNFSKADAINIKLMQDNGCDVSYLSAAERARWVKKASFIWDNWAKDMDSKGLPGSKSVETYFKLVKKYEK